MFLEFCELEKFDDYSLKDTLDKILIYIMDITNSEGASIYLEEDNHLKFYIFKNKFFSKEDITFMHIPLKNFRLKIEENSGAIAIESFLRNQIIIVDDVYNNNEFNFKATKKFDKDFGYKTKTMLTAPIYNKYDNKIIGVLQLINKKDNNNYIKYTKKDKEFIELSSYLIAFNIINMKKGLSKIELLSKKLSEKSLEVIKDPLTNLYNRRYLEEIKKNIIPVARRLNSDLSVLMIDIDFFKTINDSYGHDIGDIVLKEISKIFKNNIRRSDIAIRYGGEEFLIILQNTPIYNAKILAEKIREKVKNSNIVVNDNIVNITISIGISSIDELTDNFDVIIKKADEALYRAKERGRDTIVAII